MDTSVLRRISKKVDKVSVVSTVHYFLVLRTKLLPNQLCYRLVEPLHVLWHGKPVSYHAFALVLPQSQQHLLDIYFFIHLLLLPLIIQDKDVASENCFHLNGANDLCGGIEHALPDS